MTTKPMPDRLQRLLLRVEASGHDKLAEEMRFLWEEPELFQTGRLFSKPMDLNRLHFYVGVAFGTEFGQAFPDEVSLDN